MSRQLLQIAAVPPIPDTPFGVSLSYAGEHNGKCPSQQIE